MALVVACIASALARPATAADTSRVRVEKGQSLRQIAQRHLGDPDMWIEILKANGLSSVTEVKPGMELVLPVGEVTRAKAALRDAQAKLRRATMQGARLFAPAEIERGLARYDEAVARRKAADWGEATRLAGEAGRAAADALAVVAQARDTTAEAQLSDREGLVEGRKPQDLVWTDRARLSLLIEQERVRTLSRSSAQITFRDDSRLRLSANSQALIERMRVDPLSRREEAKVSLVEGDFYALLSGRSERKQFELEVPEVEADIDSRNFWVRRDVSGAKFTNYDDRALGVAANGASVSLGRNEGTLVRQGRPPSPKLGLLAAVALEAPNDDGETFSAEAPLSWAPAPDAVGYWLEIAGDQAFGRMVMTRWGLPDTSFRAGKLDAGTYYWRVAALDKFGLPGARSDARRFHVRVDGTPPFLRLGAPAEGALVREGSIWLRGETEPKARLRLNGGEVRVAADGSFAAELAVAPGANALNLTATDAAGNVTELARSFTRVGASVAAVRFDDAIPRLAARHFITGSDTATLAGTITPGAQLRVRGPDGPPPRAVAYADAGGRFTLNLALEVASERFDVEVVDRAGFATGEPFTVSTDREPPTLRLDPRPPAVTAVEWLPLRGRAEGARSLTLNGKPVQLAGDAFDEVVTLRSGRNVVELVATDLVGNARVEKLEVALDQDPPELTGVQLSTRQVRPGVPLELAVTARDASGLRRLALARLRVGGEERAELLELTGAPGTYRKTLRLPREVAGAVVFGSVELEDYAGNKARLTPDG